MRVNQNYTFQTEHGHLIIYHLALPVDVKTLYDLQDPPAPSLKRERDELYVREIIPPLFFSLVMLHPLVLNC